MAPAHFLHSREIFSSLIPVPTKSSPLCDTASFCSKCVPAEDLPAHALECVVLDIKVCQIRLRFFVGGEISEAQLVA